MNSDINDPESQSTRILQHALAPAPQSSSQEHRARGPASPNDGDLAAVDLSFDSRSPEGSGGHVLGEEISRQKDEGQAGTYRTGSGLFRQDGDSLVTASAGKAIATRSASCQSPPTTSVAHTHSRPTKSMPVGSRQYHRSSSPLSQDSFGGLVSQDPAELYLASARQFNVPLSDLGETPTQEAIHSSADPDLTLPDASEHKEFLEAAMRKYEAQRANGATSIRRTNVLVAATPSSSDESLGISQRSGDDFSFHNHSSEFTGRESRFEFGGSSSFDKMLDRGLVDAMDPTPELTQPEGIQPTQVGDVIDIKPSSGDNIPGTPSQSNEQRSPPFEWIAPPPSTAVASSNPRSLLRMVHPGNRYRIAKMQYVAGTVEPPSYVTTGGAETQPSRIEETQPCHVDESTCSEPPPLAPLRPRPIIHQNRKEKEEAEGALDIVPDSEPLRAAPSTQTPTHHRTLRPNSPRKPFRPCSPISEHGSGEIVPDSLEVEGSEADVPLAVELASRNTKRFVVPTENVAPGRKTRTISTVPAKAPSPALEKQSRKSSSSSTKGKTSRAKLSKAEPTEIPTSLPEQDLHGQTSSGQLPSHSTDSPPSKNNRKGPQGLESLRTYHTSVVHLPATKPVAGQKRSHKSDTESTEDWSPHPTEDEVAMPPKAQKEEEEETDSASVQDVGAPPPPLPKPDISRKKRRRTEDENPNRGLSKASTSTRNKRSETPAIATRSVKRLRSGVSSTRGLTSEPATRVFALWKQDGHYYSGVVHSRTPKSKYLIKFDDGTEDEVDPKNMRRRELRVGDRVIITQDGIKGVVDDISHADSHGRFILEIDNGEVVATYEACFDEICIANRTVQSQWKERTIDPDNIVTLIKPKLLLDTTPSKQSAVSATSSKAQRDLVKTGFVVTINPKNEEPIRTKDVAMRAIKQHGGLVIEDWSSVFVMEGKHSQSNKRWIATPQDFRWKFGANLDRVFLLSDDAHQKPKFLLALALGIPCLSFEWLTRDGKFSSDWQPFLLPAGYSDALGARISQLVDLDWGNCNEHLTDIMASRVPMKLFLQKTVLCVGADLVPLPPNRARKNTHTLEEASRYVPWIILCMGAAKVEAVIDTKQVSPSQIQAFDYIIVKDRDILGSVELGDNVVVGDVNWVKECLVSSRLSVPELD